MRSEKWEMRMRMKMKMKNENKVMNKQKKYFFNELSN